ncbi:MAG: acyl-CoA dehydrogenase family protein [Solibacillus sp.]
MTTQVNAEQLYKQLIESAHKIGQIAEGEAVEADKNATVSINVINAIKEAGINRLIIPQEYGFPQIDFTTFTDIIKQVGYYNLSAAWLTYFFSLHNSWVAYLPKVSRDEVYRDGGLLADIFSPVGKVEKVSNGYILNGKWHYVSGINYSQWVAVGALFFQQDNPIPERIGLCVKVSDLELIQDWDSLGLRGSGSNSIVAKDLFVPDEMVFNFNELICHRKSIHELVDESYLYYNTSFFSAFFVGFPAMSIGAAERAIEEFIERTKKRVRLDGTHEGYTARPQRVAAELSLKLKAAKGLLKEYIEMLENDEGQYLAGEYNAIRVKIVNYCLEIAVKVTSTLGASALAKGNPVEMLTRDMIAISTHVTSLYEDGIDYYGKDLFGIENTSLG